MDFLKQGSLSHNTTAAGEEGGQISQQAGNPNVGSGYLWGQSCILNIELYCFSIMSTDFPIQDSRRKLVWHSSESIGQRPGAARFKSLLCQENFLGDLGPITISH